MKNYQFHIEPGEENRVLALLREFNDVVIDKVSDDTINFTIELDDEEADALYYEMLMEVELRVFSERRHVH
jgi:hypothetical protein